MSEPVEVQHKHLIVRAIVQDPPKTPEEVELWVRQLVDLIGMKLIMGPMAARVEVPGNVGVTCVAGIETSHIAVHVWEEPDPKNNREDPLMQLDVYTCGKMNHHVVFAHMKQFIPTQLEFLMLDRERAIDRIVFKEDEEFAKRKENKNE